MKAIQNFVLNLLWSAAVPIYRSKYNPLRDKFSFTIPIFGAGGTGKSTMGEILRVPGSSDIPDLEDYHVTWGPEERWFRDGLKCRVVPLPGQKAGRHHWGKYIQDINDGRINYAFNVVSYGYHTLEDERYSRYKDFPLVEPVAKPMTKAKFMRNYIAQRQHEEIELMEQLASSLRPKKTKQLLTLITVINKEDLWHEQAQKVRDHYQNGDYENVHLATIDQKFKLIHYYFPVAFQRTDMVTSNSEVLARTCRSYKRHDQMASINKLARSMASYLEQPYDAE